MMIAVATIIFAVPPVPEKKSGIRPLPEYPSQIYGTRTSKNTALPQSILVILVEFQDVQFDLIPDYPDSLAHDQEYFERLLFHLSSYYKDASHGQYVLTQDNFHFLENTIMVSNDMGYYGDDEQGIERVASLLVEITELSDPQVDFNNFDSIIVFHAGAGQEADITGNNSDELWTTFLTRRSLQAGLDPENDNFPGIATDDGIFLKEFILCPETEWHSDLTDEDPIYGLLGIIVHQFGHLLGLPTLFDNDSSNGRSAGIGSFGLMGTGVWNANGFVPPLPCAWSRYYLNWENDNLIEINSSQSANDITFPSANDNSTSKLYKVNISENEYFLLENRQQNPDGSTFNEEPTFTFQLLPEGQQDVYPTGHPNEGQPKFNFMENTYEGCEWDFYLPGLGTSDIDGSGLLIWHVDELIINENFDPNFEINQINADANNKGIDLEEADGMQDLDTAFQIYSWGSPNEAFREGVNTYFGKSTHNGEFSFPTSESNYGGVQLEISQISSSDSIMTFDVKYNWSLFADYIGENPFSAALIDFDFDNENELFYAMSNGKLCLWKDSTMVQNFPYTIDSLVTEFSYDMESRSLLIPTKNQSSDIAKLFILNNSFYEEKFFLDYQWAGPVVVNSDEENRVILGLNASDEIGSKIVILDPVFSISDEVSFEADIASNLMLKNNYIFFVDSNWHLIELNLGNHASEDIILDIDGEKPSIDFSILADLDNDNHNDFLISANDSLLFCFDKNGSLFPGFPVTVPLNAMSIPSIADLDKNGYLDVLIGGENSFAVVNKNGAIVSPSSEISNPDSVLIASGVISFDIDNDGNLEVLGNMSRNRLYVWDVTANDLTMKDGYPISFGERSLNYPIIDTYSNYGINAFIPSNNGTVYKTSLPSALQSDVSSNNWKTEYANLQRTASYLDDVPPNIDPGDKIFKKDKTYFYPNPLSSTFNKAINHNMDIPANTIILRIETYQNMKVDIKIFDIAVNKIYNKVHYCEADFPQYIQIDVNDLASGVYFAILKAEGKVKKLKFAIEK